MSRRTSLSAEPKRNSASVFASSVFPVPVGPAKRKTPMGLPGSFRPAFSIAIRSTIVETASSWPITRAAKYFRIEARSARSLLSRIAAGTPVSCERLAITSCGVTVRFAPFTARVIADFRRSSTEPGKPVELRYWRAEINAVSAHAGSISSSASADSLAVTDCASVSVSSLDNGSKRISSKTLRNCGLSLRSRAAPAGDASVQTIRRPAEMAGKICSRMLAAWP